MSIAAIEATVLRDVLRGLGHPQGGLRPSLQIGEVLPARIGLDVIGAKTLMLAGVRIPATLPENLTPGQALQLRVVESTTSRLVLQVVPQQTDAPASQPSTPAPAAQQAAAAASQALPYHAVPMPGGGTAFVWADPDDGAEGGGGDRKERTRSMVVRYDSPELGRLDVVLRLGAEQLEASVFAPAGEPLSRVRGSVPKLRSALALATERPVTLLTGGRAEDIDVRA